MAKTALSARVGDFVYRPFEIMKPGKVVAVSKEKVNPHFGTPDKEECIYLEVKWMDGSVSKHWEYHLKDFNHATDEHLKKFNKFDAMRKKLANI